MVSVLTDAGYVRLGTLDESAKKFSLDSSEKVFGLKITFEAETDITLYEIYLEDDRTASDDIGEYVDPIIITAAEDTTEPANLATGKEVTVSGTSDGNKDNVNDGDTSTKWDSDFIKGTSANENSWIYMDLGADKTSIFDEMTMRYFNKIYPTLMYIQVSNDAATWYNISQLTRDHNGETYPVVTESFETPYAARHIRLFFEELNSAAAGNGVGLTEWSVTGIALSGVSLKTVSQPDAITKTQNEELTEAELPGFVTVTLTQAAVGEIEAMAPVSWDLSAYDGSQAGVYEIEGTLSLPESVDAADSTVTVTVTVNPEGAARNTATGMAYATVAEALAAAEDGQTVTLLTDCTGTNILVTPCLTLDLNSHTLTASYAVGFNDAQIIDNAGGGRLVIHKDNMVLDESNGMVPIYDGTGYLFTKAGFAIAQDDTYTGEGIKINALACPVDPDAVELLKDGCADNNIQILILLSWNTADGTGSQRFVFREDIVSEVYSSNQGAWNDYRNRFAMVITGFDSVENLTVNIMLQSGTNAEYISINETAIQ